MTMACTIMSTPPPRPLPLRRKPPVLSQGQSLLSHSLLDIIETTLACMPWVVDYIVRNSTECGINICVYCSRQQIPYRTQYTFRQRNPLYCQYSGCGSFRCHQNQLRRPRVSVSRQRSRFDEALGVETMAPPSR